MAYNYSQNNQFLSGGSSYGFRSEPVPGTYHPAAPLMTGSSVSSQFLPYPTSSNLPGMPQPHSENVSLYPQGNPSGFPQPYPHASFPPSASMPQPYLPPQQPYFSNSEPYPHHAYSPQNPAYPQPGFSNPQSYGYAPSGNYGATVGSRVDPCYSQYGQHKKRYKYKHGRYYSSGSSDEEYKYVPKSQRKQVKKMTKSLKKFTGGKLPF